MEAEVVYQALDEADSVQARVKDAAKIVDDTDGASKLWAQAPGDQVVGAPAADGSIGGDCRERRRCEKIYGVTYHQHSYSLSILCHVRWPRRTEEANDPALAE